ncbi:unnamed protein product [Heligmosomoides polygyrus]|uniref:Transposase n=1 Tax=Heligmosomoides polygyrus TaxID=6339 RepID=A0A183G6M6_HELPZ|nr:unnamed protein product [Heligmosomoides polygyrus]
MWITEEKARRRKPNRAFITRNVSFAASWIRKELASQWYMVIGNTYANQFQKLASDAQEKRLRRASVFHDNARPHVAKGTHEKLDDPG